MTLDCWDPILSGAIVEEIRTLITAIAAQSRYIEGSASSAVRLSEHALLLSYLGRLEPDTQWLHDAVTCLNAAGEKVTARLPLDLFGGLTGIGWIYSHIAGMFAQTQEMRMDSEDPILELDDLILDRTERIGQRGSYDLINGLVASGVYFLERLPLQSAVKGLSLILQHLEQRAERSAHGITWHTAPELLPAHQRERCPQGHYNLGLAHGVPGVIRFLVELMDAGIHVSTATRILDEAVRWLMAQQRDPRFGSYYGNWVSPGSQPVGERLAWCYGDLGVSMALYQAGQRVGRTDWVECATIIANRTLDHPSTETTGIGLCHGSAGIAHIYHRLFRLSQKEEYRVAAVRYYERVFRQIAERNGRDSQDYRGVRSNDNALFLDGNVGIALALLSAIAPVEPQWDRRLMLSGWKHAS
jgi:lantibiotic modifying enzyme